MKLLRRVSLFTLATLKPFRRHMLPNGTYIVVIIRGFAGVNLESESKNKVGEALVEKGALGLCGGERSRRMNGKGLVAPDYNTLITSLCRDERVSEALGILRDMAERGMEPNVVSFNAIIQGLCQEEMTEEAEELFEEMKQKGLAPDEATYTSLIQLLCNRLQSDDGYKVLTEMIDSGFSPSVVTYNDLIHGRCFDDRVEEAVGILRGMPERGLSPDVVSYNTVINTFCEMKELEKALEMKMEMVDRGILPDADTYSELIQALCPQRRLSEAFDLFREMLRGGVSPDKATYTSLMDAYCLEGEFCKAFHLHAEMVHKGFELDFVNGFSPSLVTYNALIHGLCFLERVEEALGILRGMAEMGFSPDAVSFSSVISGFCRIGELGKAYELKVEMDENQDARGLYEVVYQSLMQGLSDEVTYTSVMNDYLAQGNLKLAYTLGHEMGHNGSLPSCFITLSVLLNGLDKKARTREAKRELMWMIPNSCLSMPTYIIYDSLIENCSDNEFKSVVGLVKDLSERGLVNEAARAHDTMLEGNYKPDGAVYNLLIFDHCRSRNVHKAYNLYMEIVHYGFASHMFSVLALIEALRHDGRYNEMSWVIQNTLLRSCNLNDSELHKVLNKIDVRKRQLHAFYDVLAEIAVVGGLLLDGGKCSYASASA